MSVRTKTTEALQKDLSEVMSMWGGGIPVEQQDRVNALTSELKRRGVEARISVTEAPPNAQQTVPTSNLSDLNDRALQVELDRLLAHVGKNPYDEEAQTRFADARFEARQRAKASNGNGRNVPLKEPLPEVSTPEPMRMDQAAARREREPDFEKIAERNAIAMKEIEQVHIRMQQAQVAAIVATRMITDGMTGDDLRTVDGDQIAAACDIGLAVAAQTFAKLGLVT